MMLPLASLLAVVPFKVRTTVPNNDSKPREAKAEDFFSRRGAHCHDGRLVAIMESYYDDSRGSDTRQCGRCFLMQPGDKFMDEWWDDAK